MLFDAILMNILYKSYITIMYLVDRAAPLTASYVASDITTWRGQSARKENMGLKWD